MKKIVFLCTLFVIGMIVTNCSEDDDENMDVVAPILEVESPGFNRTYSTNLGSGLDPETVILEARAVDFAGIQSLKLIVTNSEGTIVLEKTESNSGTGMELTIVDGFETTIAGTYNIVYLAIDVNGNETTSLPRTFFYED